MGNEFDYKKYLREGKIFQEEGESKVEENEEFFNDETIDRMEGLANMRDLKVMKDMLRVLTAEWMQEGFEKDDVVNYLTGFVDII